MLNITKNQHEKYLRFSLTKFCQYILSMTREKPDEESLSSVLSKYEQRRRFLDGRDFCPKFDLHIFFEPRASFHFKAYEFGILRAFEFFQVLNEDILKWTLKFGVCIDISWRCLKTLIVAL